MIQFSKLRLTGFKSFVDHTELFIESGLTGVVGPNGCGKSNLVEALKWVMGETSAKQMRGGEMDDVIFAGSATRPARNIAEVSLALDNAERKAPAIFNNDDELAVVRRIERSKGSNYKVNGKDVRARDVQLLFADAATGARSTAMVSQGRVGILINAKPAQRRGLLEEAAGITGLHSRRHEAELRLRGAETNLGRLDDVLVTLDTQQNNLKKQARQASRYRTLSDRIRKAEALLFHLRWITALEDLDYARKQLGEAEGIVTELTARAAEASKIQATAAASLPQLREAEARAGAEFQRLTIAREALDGEERRIAETRTDITRRLDQLGQDRTRAGELVSDAQAALRRLAEEKATLLEARQSEESLQTEARAAVETTQTTVTDLEQKTESLTEQVASAEARRSAAERRLRDLEARLAKIAQRADEITRQQTALQNEAPDPAAKDAADQELARLVSGIEAAEQAQTTAQESVQQARQGVSDALEASRQCEATLTKLDAEAEALREMLQGDSDENLAPVLDSLSVEPGYEAALGAALGDDLNAPEDETASTHWRALLETSSQAFAGDLESLARFVQGPDYLVRRLGYVAVADDIDTALAAQPRLLPGQRIVTREGGMLRWDGFVIEPGAPSAGALRLKQKNRLAALDQDIARATAKLDEAEAKLTRAREAEATAGETESAARTSLQNLQRQQKDAQQKATELERKLAAYESRMASVTSTARQVRSEQEETAVELTAARTDLEDLPDEDDSRATLNSLRADLAEARTALVEKRSGLDTLLREAQARQKRLEDITREEGSWTERVSRAQAQMGDLENRRAELEAGLADLAAKPGEIAEKREKLLSAITESDTRRKAANDSLQTAESAVREADGAARKAEADLASARETRVRAEAQVDQGKQLCYSLAERIQERLDAKAEELPGIAEIEDDTTLPDLEALERSVDRLHRERDTMGPVNLRAEAELEELSEQITSLQSERADLLKAIEKLRQGINELNREGRERLLASFEEVNGHFQGLFTRLFGGGKAHLELTESDDPLEAGLEIMAMPPGKRLQVLSLLSGGEQALTALALLFAVFMTNPAPICVLDEVDAPLDDANVDRFCTMLEEICRAGSTRFLVITHHRMTMARMHRLFGVTMTERGVSQLVSVDLQKAELLVETNA